VGAAAGAAAGGGSAGVAGADALGAGGAPADWAAAIDVERRSGTRDTATRSERMAKASLSKD
jgi:hypothetical protein